MISLNNNFRRIAKQIIYKKYQVMCFLYLILISITSQIFSQDTIGVYYHTDKIKNRQSFVTKLIFMSDSTFQYKLQGDLFNDFAEGTFSQIDGLIILKYTTPDFTRTIISNDKSINTQPPTTLKVNQEFRFPNSIAHLWPTEIIKKKNKLIVIKNKENADIKIKIKFKK